MRCFIELYFDVDSEGKFTLPLIKDNFDILLYSYYNICIRYTIGGIGNGM